MSRKGEGKKKSKVEIENESVGRMTVSFSLLYYEYVELTQFMFSKLHCTFSYGVNCYFSYVKLLCRVNNLQVSKVIE